MKQRNLLTAIVMSVIGIITTINIGYAYLSHNNNWVTQSTNETQNIGSPVDYAITEDGHKVPIYLYPEDPEMIETILKLGLASEVDMKAYEQLIANNEIVLRSSASCPSGGIAATLISEGWDNDDDYYKDYEHPAGWDNDFICMTLFYYAKTGGNPPQEYHNDYQPGITRHRIKIGLSGWPAWLASQQAELRWHQ